MAEFVFNPADVNRLSDSVHSVAAANLYGRSDKARSDVKARLLIIGFILLTFVVAIGYVAVLMLSVPVANDQTVSLYIYPGDSGRQIADRVDSLRLFPSPESFRLLCKITGTDKKLKVGRYDFDSGDSRWQIYKTLEEGISATIKITVPEGLTLDRIISILAEGTSTDNAELKRLISDSSFVRSLGVDARSLEGYLLPETYLIPWGAPPEYIIRAMTDQLMSFVSDSLEDRMRETGFTLHELLTFASLIEAEARDGEERTLISSVYHNRLRKRMLLQCDPTVIYALGGLDRPLYFKDLEVDSPYNTYKYSGLPPGPICSPGAASIKAALYPDDTDYIYFVADGAGGHIFTETLQEHNAAKRRVKSKSN